MQSKLNHVKKEIKGFKRKKGKCMTIILHNSHATSCPNSKISPPYSTILPQSRVPDFRMCLFFARSGSELFSWEVDPILVGSRPHVEQFFDIQEPYAIN